MAAATQDLVLLPVLRWALWPTSNGPLGQKALLLRSGGGQVFPAGPVVNQVDDDVPHDRTPLFDRAPGYSGFVSGRFHEHGKMAS